MTVPDGTFRFEIAFSFAAPHRTEVRAVAEILRTRLGEGRIFFDEWFEHELLGDDMDALLQRFYLEQSLMVVADISDEYANRPWCQAEARAIRALRFQIDSARDDIGRLRLLNMRFSHGTVPGCFRTAGYLDGISKTPEQLAETILKRHQLLSDRISETRQSVPTLMSERQNEAASIPPIHFYHPATNDEFYSSRERELDLLDTWVADASIRIITVTGVGGLGKTALVGHWIEKRAGWLNRPFCGVFFYSFYSDRDPKAFFSAFLGFAARCLATPVPEGDTPLHHLASNVARRYPFLIVLDGLEVIQHDAEDPHYGWIQSDELTHFVARISEAEGTLLVLTSRFHEAEKRLIYGLSVFRKARQARDLPEALLALARLRIAMRDETASNDKPLSRRLTESALDHVEEAVLIAARGGYMIAYCDALSLRASVRRHLGTYDASFKDARQAFDIAKRCQYLWGKKQAVRELCELSAMTENHIDANHWAQALREINLKLKPLMARALELERAHDTEMEQLYSKKTRWAKGALPEKYIKRLKRKSGKGET